MRFVHRWKQLVHDLSFLGPCVLQWKQKGAICLEGINPKALSGSYEQRRVELSADAPRNACVILCHGGRRPAGRASGLGGASPARARRVGGDGRTDVPPCRTGRQRPARAHISGSRPAGFLQDHPGGPGEPLPLLSDQLPGGEEHGDVLSDL